MSERLHNECAAMIFHLLGSGQTLPPGVVADVEEAKARGALEALANVHNQLAVLVEPAKPGTLYLLACERAKSRFGRLFGPTVLVRGLVGVALPLTIAFVILAAVANTGGSDASSSTNNSSIVSERRSSAERTTTKVEGDGDKPSSDRSLFDVLYLLTAAGLGATFAALFRANKYLGALAYEKRFEFSYWLLVVLGVIGGLVLSLLVPIESGAHLTQPLLALLGGFAAPAVHRVLDRLVDSVLTLFGPEEVTSSRPRAAALAGASDLNAEPPSKPGVGIV